jgi:hypothetical protein
LEPAAGDEVRRPRVLGQTARKRDALTTIAALSVEFATAGCPDHNLAKTQEMLKNL